MSALSPERLDEIRGCLSGDSELPTDAALAPMATQLLDEVDHLRAELATAETAWQEWRESSRAGHAHATDMASEVARLREGVAALIERPTWHRLMYGSPWDMVRTDDLRDLLNPTKGSAPAPLTEEEN